MSWWMWYVPVGAMTALAYLYAKWSYRPRGPQEPSESVQAYERFRQVMAAPTPVPRSRRPHRDRAIGTRR
jgi:hypothetical protein